MRCSVKSTSCRASVVAALWILAAVGTAARHASFEEAIQEAVRASVLASIGQAATVTVDVRRADLPAAAVVEEAHPEPGSRFGRSARFRLVAGGRSVGYAVVVVNVSVDHVRVQHALKAGEVVTPDMVRDVYGDPGGLPIAPLPTVAELAGTTTIRALAANEVVTNQVVRIPLAVRSGERVVVRTVVGGIEARGVATALQSGRVGEVIRLVNPESRRQLRGRVVGRAEVEVEHGS
jgi:flagella basal body P-ring formation protein FlgA